MKKFLTLLISSALLLSVAGCGLDSDGDGESDVVDQCPLDPNKTNPGICGCGTTDHDSDSDNTPDCKDNCPDDPNKTEPGECGCNVPEGTCSDPNQIPVLRFVKPSEQVAPSDLGVVVEASDPDGEVVEVSLDINNTFVRMEGQKPYEWGTANADHDDPLLLDLAPGTYELRAEALDDDGGSSTVTISVTVEESNNDGVDASTMDNKIMAGYQGWFSAKNDGSYNKWDHWCSHKQDMPRPENVLFDNWPDLREYAPSELYPTGFTYADGSNAGLYSAANASTVHRHMKWSRDYGIDGVFVQRFMAAIHDGKRAYRDKVLLNVKAGAEKYGRVFVNMWDINSLENKDPSGWHDAGLVNEIKKDWKHLVDDLKITSSNRYLNHNGRPLIAIWGVSKEDVMEAKFADELVDWFHNDAAAQYRASVMFGVTNEVGSTKVDWQDKPTEWQNVFRKIDIISPWTVGRFRGESGADNFYDNHIRPDKEKCDEYGVDYLPVVFPGFSACQKHDKPCNATPRNGGKFIWRQFYNAIRAGSKMVYVAMFDEVDEGTAIFKLAENQDQTPVQWPNNNNHHEFIVMDADGYELPSDWYLRLTGEAANMLRDEIGLTSTIPISP